MNPLNKLFSLIVRLSCIVMLVIGCSKDESDIEQDSFYRNALKSATISSIQGIWSLYEVEFNGRKISVPNENMQCDRDFFIYNASGIYQEYVINSSLCSPEILEFNWVVTNGIITITSGFDTQELVITSLDNEKLVFKAKVDIDEDGVEDILSFTARKYTPTEKGFYGSSFFWDSSEENDDKIRLTWLPYNGLGNFDRYEIYRSNEECSKFNGDLIANITDKNIDFFLDENPPVKDHICYYYKVFTDKGILSESELASVFTDRLRVPSVELSTPIVSGETIQLNWAEFQGYYFSHYEIRVQNFIETSGNNHFSEIVTSIDDIQVTSFLDTNPPYLTNPIYSVRVYDIFGNSNNIYIDLFRSTKVATYKKPELLDFANIVSYKDDPDNTYLYLLGQIETGNSIIQKYNYSTNTVEAFTNTPIPYGFSEIKLTQTSNGKEITVAYSGEIRIYNAENLTYKYTLKPSATYYSFDNYISLANDIWVFVHDDIIYSYKRDNANLILIDQKSHPITEYNYQKYDVIDLHSNKILIGRVNGTNSILFNVSNDGLLSEGTSTGFSLKSVNGRTTIYNPNENFLVNLSENRIYSAETFSLLRSFETPYFSTGISTNGNLIFGANNDFSIYTDDVSIYEKKVHILNLTNNLISTYDSEGYPNRVFENHLGQIISISTGFVPRENLSEIPLKNDIFVEIIN